MSCISVLGVSIFPLFLWIFYKILELLWWCHILFFAFQGQTTCLTLIFTFNFGQNISSIIYNLRQMLSPIIWLSMLIRGIYYLDNSLHKRSLWIRSPTPKWVKFNEWKRLKVTFLKTLKSVSFHYCLSTFYGRVVNISTLEWTCLTFRVHFLCFSTKRWHKTWVIQIRPEGHFTILIRPYSLFQLLFVTFITFISRTYLNVGCLCFFKLRLLVTPFVSSNLSWVRAGIHEHHCLTVCEIYHTHLRF